MRSLLLVTAVALLLAVPVAAQGADFKRGDVFVGTITGQYNVFSNQGTLLETIDQGLGSSGFRLAEGCAFDRSGVLYTSAFSFGKVVRFVGAAPHTKLPPITVAVNPDSIAFARDGNFYVGHQSSPGSLRRFSPAGLPNGTFNPPFQARQIDLSADQRTVFYSESSFTGSPKVHRFDVVADKPLPDFADLGTTGIGDVKLLPPGDGSGGAIVTQPQSIKRVNGAGKVVQSYDRTGENGWAALALDPDGKSFWAESSPGSVYRFDTATGAVDRGPLPSTGGTAGLCVNGSHTAALDNAAPSIAITTPAQGATFQQGQDVRAAFRCTDDKLGTGIDRCAGPVASGGRLDTSTPGTKTFRVDAADKAGNRAAATRTFRVLASPPPPPPPSPPMPPSPPPAPERIVVTLSTDFPSFFTTPKLSLLTVREVPSGSTVTATCKTKRGKRCSGIRKFTKRNARGDVKIRGFLGRRLPVGVIEVRVTKPGAIGAVKLFKVFKGKRPKTFTRCLPPGTTKPTRC